MCLYCYFPDEEQQYTWETWLFKGQKDKNKKFPLHSFNCYSLPFKCEYPLSLSFSVFWIFSIIRFLNSARDTKIWQEFGISFVYTTFWKCTDFPRTYTESQELLGKADTSMVCHLLRISLSSLLTLIFSQNSLKMATRLMQFSLYWIAYDVICISDGQSGILVVEIITGLN